MKKLIAVILAALLCCLPALAETPDYLPPRETALEIVFLANEAAAEVDDNYEFVYIDYESEDEIWFSTENGLNKLVVTYSDLGSGVKDVKLVTMDEGRLGTNMTIFYYILSTFYGHTPEMSAWVGEAVDQLSIDIENTDFASRSYPLAAATAHIDLEYQDGSYAYAFVIETEYALLVY